MVYYDEGTTGKMTITFYDEDGVKITPTGGTYKITDALSGDVIKAETPFTPVSSSHVIRLTSNDTKIVNSGNAQEERIVTLEWDYSLGGHGNSEFRYYVNNLNTI